MADLKYILYFFVIALLGSRLFQNLIKRKEICIRVYFLNIFSPYSSCIITVDENEKNKLIIVYIGNKYNTLVLKQFTTLSIFFSRNNIIKI